MSQVHYSEYLQLDKILGAQAPESDKINKPAHDEMLFIVVHQAYELWFRQLLHEVGSVTKILSKPAVNDNSPEVQTIVHRLSRSVSILKLLVHQIDIMETMTAMDFLDFRDLLRPASGFQSWQFKILEARLGLKYENRHGKDYYISQLKPHEVNLIRDAENQPSLLKLVNDWLERMPFTDEGGDNPGQIRIPGFWNNYRNIYESSLQEGEKNNLKYFDQVFFGTGEENSERSLSPKACKAALFIMLYRGYPILHLPFQLLNNLLEIDEQMSTWRYRHMNMVQRMIGKRIGTGGSTGKDYLKAALDKHYIFSDIAQLTSFLIERSKLPSLPEDVERLLGFDLK